MRCRKSTVSAAAGRGTGSDMTRAGAAPALRTADNKGSLNQIKQVAGFAATWEIDLFGGYRRAIEAGRYDIEAAAAARSAVLLSVVADVARNYVDMRGLQVRLAILQENIATAQQSRDFEQMRYDRGLTNELDLQLAIREFETLRSELPLLRSQLEATQYNIAALLGEYPESLAAELAPSGALPDLPEGVAPGLPLDVLQRRPDVRAAERRLAAATARIGVATANLFPHVALSGGLGTQSASIGAHGSHIWGFGPAVYWPVLDFGTLDAMVNIADLQAHEQLVAYRKTLIDAVQDADGAIANYSAQVQRLDSLANAMLASQRAVTLAQQRYNRGLTDYSERGRCGTAGIRPRRELYRMPSRVPRTPSSTSIRRLGGGWEQYQNVPRIRLPGAGGYRRVPSTADQRRPAAMTPRQNPADIGPAAQARGGSLGRQRTQRASAYLHRRGQASWRATAL